MKKYLLLIAVLLILNFVASAQERLCPDGYEQRDIYLTYSIPG